MKDLRLGIWSDASARDGSTEAVVKRVMATSPSNFLTPAVKARMFYAWMDAEKLGLFKTSE